MRITDSISRSTAPTKLIRLLKAQIKCKAVGAVIRKESMKNRRKKFLIIPKFQLPLIYFVSSLFLIFSLIALGLVIFNFHEMKLLGHEIGLSQDHPFFEFVHNQQKLLTLSFATFIIFGLVGNFFFILFFSHRLAGPIYKLIRFLEEDDHKGQKIIFRKDDFLKPYEEKLNNLFEAQNSK